MKYACIKYYVAEVAIRQVIKLSVMDQHIAGYGHDRKSNHLEQISSTGMKLQLQGTHRCWFKRSDWQLTSVVTKLYKSSKDAT